jgi:cytochrome c-type biogenesis protein
LGKDHSMSAADSSEPKLRHSKGGLFRLAAVVVVALLLASAWLVFPYLFEGRALLEDVSARVSSERNAEQVSLGEMLTRWADGPGDADVDVLFATATYFERASTPRVAAQYGSGRYLIFILNENIHVGELPQQLPKATLLIDGNSYEPVDREGPELTDHHRSTILRFALSDPWGDPIIQPGTSQIELSVSNNWDDANTSRSVSWSLPISYPDAAGSISSPIVIMSLAAGLLSVTLTPCLIQLIVVYMASLTGVGAEQMSSSQAVAADVRRKMMISALAFVIGFTLFYTAAGAVIGYAGRQAQLVFAAYNREVAFGAGILVILMGLWTGIKARAPLVCRLPMPRKVSEGDSGGFLRSALLAAGFSLGCMVCFSGAIIATLFVYVGSLGSASTGAFILFLFSLGVAVPFLAAAFFMSRTMSVMHWVSRYTPQLGFVSMVVIVAFGLVLITDNFHTVSDIIYPWLGLD